MHLPSPTIFYNGAIDCWSEYLMSPFVRPIRRQQWPREAAEYCRWQTCRIRASANSRGGIRSSVLPYIMFYVVSIQNLANFIAGERRDKFQWGSKYLGYTSLSGISSLVLAWFCLSLVWRLTCWSRRLRQWAACLIVRIRMSSLISQNTKIPATRGVSLM